MPEFETTAHPGNATQRSVTLLAKSTNSLWLSSDDVEWLVTWLATEHKTGGIALLDPAVAGGDLQGNCATPGVHIRWDFDGFWEAIVLEGRLAGNIVQSHVAKLSLEKWTRADAVHHYGIPFDAATRAHRKKATFDFLELHMQNVMQGE